MKILSLGTCNIRFTNFETNRDPQEEMNSYMCYRAYNHVFLLEIVTENLLKYSKFQKLSEAITAGI